MITKVIYTFFKKFFFAPVWVHPLWIIYIITKLALVSLYSGFPISHSRSTLRQRDDILGITSGSPIIFKSLQNEPMNIGVHETLSPVKACFPSVIQGFHCVGYNGTVVWTDHRCNQCWEK